jgi:hypothetical protein
MSRLTNNILAHYQFSGNKIHLSFSSACEDGSIALKTGSDAGGLFPHHCSTSAHTSNALRSVDQSFRKETPL